MADTKTDFSAYDIQTDAPVRPDVDINALGQAMDTTWGRSSTPKTSSYSVKLTMAGPDRIVASYAAIVNFGTEKEMILMKRAYAEESQAVTNAYMKAVKARYKDITGSSFTAKEISATDSLEITNFGVHNPKRTAYYRRKTIFEIA